MKRFWLLALWGFTVLSSPSISVGQGIQRVWAIDDGERVKKTELNHPLMNSPNNKVWNGSSISLFGARNEVLAFQLMIQGNGTGATNVNVVLDSLHKSVAPKYTIKNTGGTDPYNYVGRPIEMFVEHYMNITDRTKSNYIWWGNSRPLPDANYTGLQPEILVPFAATPGAKSHGQGGAPFSVTANQNQGVWVDIYVPRDAQSGDYSGTLKVTENAVLRYSIPVNLKVYNFALPDSSHLRNAFLFTEGTVASRHGLTVGSAAYWSMVRKYYAMFYRHRANGQHTADTTAFKTYLGQVYKGSYFSPESGYAGPGERIGPNYYSIGGFDQPGRVAGAGTATDSSWSQIPGGNYYAMRGRGPWTSGVSYQVNDVVTDNDYPYLYWCKRAHTSSTTNEPQESGTGSTGWKKYWVRYYDRGYQSSFAWAADTTTWKQNWWRAEDWWVNWFANNNPSAWITKYGPEEPNIENGIEDTSAFADIRRKIRWLRSNPSGKVLEYRLATRFMPEQWPVNQLVDVIFNGPNQFGFGGVVIDSVEAALARGQRVGLYGGTRPHWGTEVIDAPATDIRMKPWAMWKHGITEYSYWATSLLDETNINPWDRDRSAYGSVIKYGDGTLIYQGQDNRFPGDSRGLAGPVAGIRLKNWRRGAQDYEYLYIARQMGLNVNALVDSLIPKVFDEILPTDKPTWGEKGYKYEDGRRKLAELIASAISPLPYGTFSVNPTLLTSGPGNVTLNWTSVNATGAGIDNGVGAVPVSGSRVVHVDSTTTFILTLSNTHGNRTYQSTVTVRLLPGGTFNANPDTLSATGGNTTLSWTSSNAVSATINQGIGNVPVNGSTLVPVDRLKTFTLTLNNNDGSRSYDATVFLRTAPSGLFTVSPDSISAEGEEVTLSWVSVNATEARIETGTGTGTVHVSDTIELFLDRPTDYRLILTNPFGTQSYLRHVYQHPIIPKYVAVPPESLVAKDQLSGRMLKPIRRGRRAYPNWANLLSEVVIQGGFQPGATESDSLGGMRVGISTLEQFGTDRWRPSRGSERGWARLSKWKSSRRTGYGYTSIQTAIEDRSGKHQASPHGFDSTGVPGLSGRRPLLTEQANLGPKKFNDMLYAELIALKVNIAASQLEKTPAGFGELVFDVDGNPLDEMSVLRIANRADSAMTFWRGRSQQEYQTLFTAIRMINRAFVSPLDTVYFEAGGQLKIRGSVLLSSVPFLKQVGTDPLLLVPGVEEIQEDDLELEELFGAEGEGSVESVRLFQNYPNPFNPSTSIRFALRYPAIASLKIYNILGQEVKTLLTNEMFDEGFHEVDFDASDISSGVYFYRLVAQSEEGTDNVTTFTRKMLFLK